MCVCVCIKIFILYICTYNSMVFTHKPHIYIYGSIFFIHLITPISSHDQDVTQSQFCKWSLTGLKSEFSFLREIVLPRLKTPSLSYYLPIAGERMVGFIPFPKGYECYVKYKQPRIRF